MGVGAHMGTVCVERCERLFKAIASNRGKARLAAMHVQGGFTSDLLVASLEGSEPSTSASLGTMLIKDSLEASATFLVHALLCRALQAGDKVVLLAVEQTLEKYKYCQRKLGVGLQQCMDSGQLHVLGLKDIGLSGPDRSSSPAGALKQLYQALLQAVQQQQSSCSTGAAPTPAATEPQGVRSGAVTVILDNLSVLAALGSSSSDWLTFLQLCTALGRHVSKPFTCILVAHNDIPEDSAWLRYLEHLAHVVLDVMPLGARMADIDGKVIITRRSSSTPYQGAAAAGLGLVQRQEALQAVRCLYFRAGELGVKWIPQVATSDLM